jgi:hypothetical protein
MRVLVTGGAGFIGSHVVDRLRVRGHEPRIFDLVHSPYCDGEVDSTIGDRLDPEAVRAAIRGCDAVVHLAAVADVNVVLAEPARAELVNVRGTQVMLEAARDAGVGRFLFASTVWVYGSVRGRGPIGEDTPLVLPSHAAAAAPPLPADFWTAFPNADPAAASDWEPVGPARAIAALDPREPAIAEWDWPFRRRVKRLTRRSASRDPPAGARLALPK